MSPLILIPIAIAFIVGRSAWFRRRAARARRLVASASRRAGYTIVVNLGPMFAWGRR